VTSIIMLCKVVECMQDKCAQYWPTELFMAEEYGSIDVLMEEEEFLEFAIKRIFLLCHNSGKSRKGCNNELHQLNNRF
jgi:protein tyrosine phosphatase